MIDLLSLLFFFQNASKNEDYSSIADVDALFLVAGDPASEDEPMRKGTCFQVRPEPPRFHLAEGTDTKV